MAFPVVAAVNGGYEAEASTEHTVNLPADIGAGDLLLVFFGSDGVPTITFPEGWTELFQESNGNVTLGAWYRVADGEEGATITVTTSVSEMASHNSYRITGYSGTPEISLRGTGSSTIPNPRSLTPTWGAKDTLWFAVEGNDSNPTVTDYPADYTDGRNDVYDGFGGCGVGSARRELNAESEDPGVFTISGSEEWVTVTIAIRPYEVFETLRPNANGANTNLYNKDGSQINNYSYVDEVIPDDDTTYVKSGVGTAFDTYGLPNSGVGAGTINSVTVYARAKVIPVGGDGMRICCYTHSNTYYGSAVEGNSDYINYSKQWTENPNTELAWTWEEIDALEAGIELTKGEGYTPYCTQVWVEVDYSVGPEVVEGSAAGSGIGLASSSAKLDVLAQVLGNGIGLSQSSSYLIISGLASGEGIGLASATGQIVGIIVEGTGAGSGIGTATVQGILDILAEAGGSGEGLGIVIIEIPIFSSESGLGIERASRAGWLMKPAVYTKEAFEQKTYTGE